MRATPSLQQPGPHRRTAAVKFSFVVGPMGDISQLSKSVHSGFVLAADL